MTAKKDYKKLLVDFTAAYAKRESDPILYAQTLTDLATAVVYSVLKKCIDTGSSDTLTQLRRDIARDKSGLDRLTYAGDTAYIMVHSASGDTVRIVADEDSARALSDLQTQTLGDGIDLVHTAIVAILSEVQRQEKAGEAVDLERPYTIRRLKRKVWIKSADSVGGWETVETAPIQEVYKAVRRHISQSRSIVADPRSSYSYIEDIIADPESDATDAIYRRLGKCADLGGYVTDFNGAYTVYTTDMQSVCEYDEIVSRLNLTKRQSQILDLRMRGYGYKAIATYFGISMQGVDNTLKRIQEKAKKFGFAPEK